MFDLSTRVLVVDDFLSMRRAVTHCCKEIGFTDIVEAADGLEAWKALEGASPPVGLIISDVTMPNMTGLQLLQKVRTDPRFTKLPFVMITAEGEQEYVIAAAKAAGAGGGES